MPSGSTEREETRILSADRRRNSDAPLNGSPASVPGQGPASRLFEPTLVGSLFWTLRRGDQWVLGPDSVFLFRDCWRTLLAREAYMLARPSSTQERWKNTALTVGRRWITGEPFLLDLYEAQQDGAELAISSDEIGGNLYVVEVTGVALICRKTVYFGSELDVMLRVTSPLIERFPHGDRAVRFRRLMRSAYGPGWVFQRFVARPGGSRNRIILQIDGDAYLRELGADETLRIDPRHAYAWDETISWRLVKFGAILDRLLRGSVPFQVEFIGPGRIWLSNMSFSDGYMGEVCTPSHWVFRAQQGVRRLISYLNPVNWL